MISCPVCNKDNEGDTNNLNWNELAVCDFCGTSYAEETCYDTDMSDGTIEYDDYYNSNSYEIIVRTWDDNEAISTNFNMKRKKYIYGQF